MARMRITAGALEALHAKEAIWDDQVIGFGARRQMEDGEVSFIFKAKLAGSRRQIFVTIGKYRRGDWTIAEARSKAVELRHAVRRGINPNAERRERQGAMTVAELCDKYIEIVSRAVV